MIHYLAVGVVAVASAVGQGWLLSVVTMYLVDVLAGGEVSLQLGRSGGYLAIWGLCAVLCLPVGGYFALTALEGRRRRALGWVAITLCGLGNALGLWASAAMLGMVVSLPLLLWLAGFGGLVCAGVATVPIGWLWVRFVRGHLA